MTSGGVGTINPSTGAFTPTTPGTGAAFYRFDYHQTKDPSAVVNVTASDEIDPEIEDAATDTAGTQITLTPSETVTYDSPNVAHWAVRQNGVAVEVTDVDFASNEIVLTVEVFGGKTTVVDFVGGADTIEDTAGNDLADFADMAVTNNSTVFDYLDPDPNDIEALASLVTGGANILSRLPRG